MATDFRTPGVYWEEVTPPRAQLLRTGVPAFLGFAGDPTNEPGPGETDRIRRLTLWPQFAARFGPPASASYLAYAVRGFFENGGQLCYVVRLDAELDRTSVDQALAEGLALLAPLTDIDLVCAPDIMRAGAAMPDLATALRLQNAVLDHCDLLGDRFAILDSRPITWDPVAGDPIASAVSQAAGLHGNNGALYYPWVTVLRIDAAADAPAADRVISVPPCGHVAGIYARSDERVGVFKAPANELLEGVLDLADNLTAQQQALLNPENVNCLRSFPGRGLRVWGARTLSAEAAWRYVSVRRLFLTAGRWIERNLSTAAFEPNDLRLWARISRELTAYFTALYERGALQGASAAEAFYVRCDATTNPPEVREQGLVVTEIGLAPALPDEFVVVRVIHGASGVTIAGPVGPG